VPHEDNPVSESGLQAVTAVGSRTLSPVERLLVVVIGHVSLHPGDAKSTFYARERDSQVFVRKYLALRGTFRRQLQCLRHIATCQDRCRQAPGCRSADRVSTVLKTKIVFVFLAQRLSGIENSIIATIQFRRTRASTSLVDATPHHEQRLIVNQSRI
jgi:hypothetical protein